MNVPAGALGLAMLASSAAACQDHSASHVPVYLLGGHGKDDTKVDSGVRIPVGASAVFASNIVRHRGDTEAVLLSGSFVPPRQPLGATVTDVRIFDFKRVGSHPLVADRWPSQEVRYADTVPVPGYRLRPGSDVALLVIIRADQQGEWTWPQARITFRYHGHTYSDTVNNASTVCVDKVKCYESAG